MMLWDRGEVGGFEAVEPDGIGFITYYGLNSSGGNLTGT